MYVRKDREGIKRPLTEKDLDALPMDDDIRESICAEIAPCSPAEFLAAYVEAAESDYTDMLEHEYSITDEYWYAVVKEGDNDWGSGSYDYDEALNMVYAQSDTEDDRQYIAIINDGPTGKADPICVREVHFSDDDLDFIAVKVNGERKMMTYEAVCQKLGIIPDIHFVEVDEEGQIGFTCGKPEEVKYLLASVRENGMFPTDGLFKAAMGRKMGVKDRMNFHVMPQTAPKTQPTKEAMKDRDCL